MTNKAEYFKCPRCGGSQVSSDVVDTQLFHHNKEKPEAQRWESYIWIEFSCVSCDEEWAVKCDVTPTELERMR